MVIYEVNNKTALLHIFEAFYPTQKLTPSADSLITDSPALVLSPRSESKTFADYVDMIIIPYLEAKKTFYKRIDLVFDVYHDQSIKSFTRKKRGCGQRVKVLESTLISTKSQWHEFLRNGQQDCFVWADFAKSC